MNILIIEDNAGDITLLRRALDNKRLGGTLTVVRDGASALDIADTIDSLPDAVCPDLVILDLNLPKVDGREILKRFRASMRLSRAPILVLSSSRDERDKVSALSMGASEYLHKSLDLEEFMSIGKTGEALLSSRHHE